MRERWNVRMLIIHRCRKNRGKTKIEWITKISIPVMISHNKRPSNTQNKDSKMVQAFQIITTDRKAKETT